MSPPAKILVLGAGELGLSMLTALSAKTQGTSTTIHVLLRPSTYPPSAKKQAEIARLSQLKIAILRLDIATTSIPDLALAFSDYDLIISCLGFASGPGSQLKIARAVLEGSVNRYVPWQFGVDYDVIGKGSAQTLFDEQLDVRDLLRGQQRTEWVIISTGMFTSFLFEGYFGVVNLEEGVVRALGGWENKITVTTPDDIGKLTAEILLQDEERRARNEVVYTAGETITYGALADLVAELSGKKIKREVWTVPDLKEKLVKDPENNIAKYRVVFAEGKGCSWEIEKTFNWKEAIKVEDVRAWAKANVFN